MSELDTKISEIDVGVETRSDTEWRGCCFLGDKRVGTGPVRATREEAMVDMQALIDKLREELGDVKTVVIMRDGEMVH